MNLDGGVGRDGYHSNYYGARDWRFYRFLLSLVMTHGKYGKILDVGCGTGLFVEAATRWGLDCVGVDGAEAAIRIALGRCARLQVKQHLLSEPLPFFDESFQTVVINQVIEHLEPVVAGAVLLESFRVLVPGGLIYIGSPSRNNTKERLADPTHINLYTPLELLDLIRQTGFDGIIPLVDMLPIFGHTSIGSMVTRAIYKLSGRRERVSASANFVAFKPSAFSLRHLVGPVNE